MADEQQTQQESQGGGGKKIVIIAIVGALVVGGGAAAAVALLMGGGSEAKPQKNAPAAQAPAVQVPAQPAVPQDPTLPAGPPKGPLVPFDTIIVNLNEPGGTRYLKVNFEVEVSTKALEKEIEKMKIPIKDALIEYLASLTLSETQSMDAKRKIKVEIIRRMNRFLTSGRVLNIYFTEFVVQ